MLPLFQTFFSIGFSVPISEHTQRNLTRCGIGE